MKSKRGKSVRKAPKPTLGPAFLPVLILLAALVFRIVSLSTFDPLVDEKITRDVVTGIWNGELSNNWKYTVTEPEYRVDMYNFSSYMYADALIAGLAGKLAARLPNGDPDFVLWSRLFSALAGTLAVYLFYLVARRLFGQGTAIVAMVLMAVMPLLVQDAHYARPEAFVLALTAAAYLFLPRFDSHPGRLRYLGYSSFCFGLLIACKFSLIPMALLSIVFLAPIRDRQGETPDKHGPFIRGIGVCAGGTLLGLFVGVSDAFFHPSAYWHGVQFLLHQYAGASRPHAVIDGTNSVSLTALYFWQTTGLLLLFSMAGAFVLAMTRRFVLLAALGGPVAFYLVYFSLQRTFFERNLSHVAPLMAILAAVALTALSEKIRVRSGPVALIALTALAAVPALWVSYKLVFIAMRTTTEQRAVNYQIGILKTVRNRLDLAGSLFTDGQFDQMMQLAKAPKSDYLVRVADFHDSYTKNHLEELERQTKWREVGYFPSVFEGFDVNTMIAYHSVSFRYLFLSASSPAP
jgi:hypothetical protein